MGAIDLNNYEAFLLDYFEGNLSSELTVELKAFLLLHPELNIDLNDTELISLPSDELKFSDKDRLIKNEFDGDARLISYVEGLLTEEEKRKLEQEASMNASLEKDLHLFKKTVLQAEATEIFEAKQELIKTADDLVLNNRTLAYLEGALSAEEQAQFILDLQSRPSLQKELKAYESTKLQSDLTIQYPQKEALRKEAKVIAIFTGRRVAAMAAAVTLVFGLAVVLKNVNSDENVTPSLAGRVKTPLFRKDGSAKSPLNNDSVESDQLFASNNSVKSSVRQNVANRDSSLRVNENKTLNENVAKDNIRENLVLQPDTIGLASNNTEVKNVHTDVQSKEPVTKYTSATMLALVEDDEVQPKTERNGFWKRAVKVVQQANNLGVKAVKADEKEGDAYSLSFNTFSIEKK